MIFHKPNAVQTRSRNGNDSKYNGKGREVGRKKTNELVLYTWKMGQRGGGG